MATIDFDEIEAWGPLFEQFVLEIAPTGLLNELVNLQLEYDE